jgi:hypothetical protein
VDRRRCHGKTSRVPNSTRSVYLNLDDAWNSPDGFEELDLRVWGPKLRYHGRRDEVNAFYDAIRDQLTDFVLYGSGDFHYLAGVLLRRVERPVTVVSFDNHPDWDVRPPHWTCGGWVNRAVELPNVQQVVIWGCGNFELTFPSRIFANYKALRNGRIHVHPWAERQPASVCKRFDCMTRDTWQECFSSFAARQNGKTFYVTVDLDCLSQDQAITNWENGLFTATDVSWAIQQLRSNGNVVAGDLCGAWSRQHYARRFQRFVARWDHPRIDENPPEAQTINHRALQIIWPALSGHPI